ncbi:MAG: hypothetical protein IJX39_09800 [Clostridia bacterium]|nr:hypothetical protein [Clostridia bacterium]
MKKNWKIYVIGSSLIALALIIVLLAVFLPKIVHRSEMKDLFESILAPDPAFVTVGDPLYNTGDALGNRGKEVILEGETRTEVLDLIAALSEGGYRIAAEEKKTSGAWDLSLRVRSATGETLYLYFTESTFYYMNDTLAVHFEPKDAALYATLYEKMNAILAE